jgi:hypothetical protein
VPLATVVPLVVLLLVDVFMAAVALTAGDGCPPTGGCRGVDQSRWHFGAAGIIALAAYAGVVIAAALRVRRWWQWTIAGLAVGGAVWPVVWIVALGQPYLVG